MCSCATVRPPESVRLTAYDPVTSEQVTVVYRQPPSPYLYWCLQRTRPACNSLAWVRNSLPQYLLSIVRTRALNVTASRRAVFFRVLEKVDNAI